MLMNSMTLLQSYHILYFNQKVKFCVSVCVCDFIFITASFNSAIVCLINVTKLLHMEIS
jgi:hypothetical protein